MTDMDKILAAGASIIVRPIGWNNEASICLCVELHGLRHGLRCADLTEGFERAYEWVRDVEFYHGTQWSADQLAYMKARSAA